MKCLSVNLIPDIRVMDLDRCMNLMVSMERAKDVRLEGVMESKNHKLK